MANGRCKGMENKRNAETSMTEEKKIISTCSEQASYIAVLSSTRLVIVALFKFHCSYRQFDLLRHSSENN